jgi:SAM-dependent methyltransferase
MPKKSDWFVNYESQRDLNFRKLNLLKGDLQNSTVIDFGCNTGQMCRYACDVGAKYALGIDYDNTAINQARIKSKKYNNIDFLTDDIDNYMLYTNLQDFDTGFFFSVIGTKELQNRYGILSKLSSKILKTMYIEGHHNVFRKNELFNAILNHTTFTSIEYLGLTYDNAEFKKSRKSRDLFRCSRKIYTQQETLNKFFKLLRNDNKLIAVQGHGGVGKTTLKAKLISFLNENNIKFDKNLNTKGKGYFISLDRSVCILDDVANANIKELKKKHKFIIYFDYRVLGYLKDEDIHTLFIINYDIKSRFNNRPKFTHHRSAPINKFIKNIYHIESYN